MSNALRIAHGEFGRVALLDMDASLVRHAHPHCHVLIKAEGADTQFWVRGRLTPLTRRQAVLVNAWEPHAYLHDPGRPRTTILALYIEPRWLTHFRRNWAASGAPGFFAAAGAGISPRIRKLADDLAGTMMHDPGAGETQQRLLSDLMISVIERFTPWQTISPRDAARRSPVDFRIRRAIGILRQDPGHVTDMGRLAREAGLSRAHFFRLFEQSVRMSPRVYLNALRIEHAVDTVIEGDVMMGDISDRLGFSVPAHFTRFFRDHTGAAPREFRAVARLGRPALEVLQ